MPTGYLLVVLKGRFQFFNDRIVACRRHTTLALRLVNVHDRNALRRDGALVPRVCRDHFCRRVVQRGCQRGRIYVSVNRRGDRLAPINATGRVFCVDDLYRVVREGMGQVIRVAGLIRVTRSCLRQRDVPRFCVLYRDWTCWGHSGVALFSVVRPWVASCSWFYYRVGRCMVLVAVWA